MWVACRPKPGAEHKWGVNSALKRHKATVQVQVLKSMYGVNRQCCGRAD